MRNLLPIGSLCLSIVVFSACKTAARQSLGELQAISDEKLTLGLVPIQKSNEMHAYRLLLCKKSNAYPLKLLENDDQCRIALHDKNGAEVAFWPNDFKRDFATKYKGYAKHAAVASIAVIPLVLTGAAAGVWKITRLIRKELKNADSLKISDFSGGKFSAKLINKGLRGGGLRYYHGAWYWKFTTSFEKIEVASDVSEIATQLKELNAVTEVFTNAAELRALEDGKHLVEQIKKIPTDNLDERYSRIEDTIREFNDGMLFGTANSFTGDFVKIKKQYQDLIAATKGKSLDEAKDIAKKLEVSLEEYSTGLTAYEDLHTKSKILATRNSGNLDTLLKQMNAQLDTKKSELLASENDALRIAVESLEAGDKARRNASVYALGGGVLALSFLSSIDKSIWGYADRQLSEHWNQIFVSNDDFVNAQPVKDIHVILQALANEFDFVVSKRALQLSH